MGEFRLLTEKKIPNFDYVVIKIWNQPNEHFRQTILGVPIIILLLILFFINYYYNKIVELTRIIYILLYYYVIFYFLSKINLQTINFWTQ